MSDLIHFSSNEFMESSRVDNSISSLNLYDSSIDRWKSSQTGERVDSMYLDGQSNLTLKISDIFDEESINAEAKLLRNQRIDHTNRVELQLIYENLAERDIRTFGGEGSTSMHLRQINAKLQEMGVELVVHRDVELVERAQAELVRRGDYFSSAVGVLFLRDTTTGDGRGEPIIITRPSPSRVA